MESGPIRLSGLLAWLIWLSVHIAYLVGFCNRFLVLLQWAWAYLTRQRSARLITCEPLAEMHEQERAVQEQSVPIPTEETADSSTHTVNQERRNYADRHAQDSAL